jgi:hypothetical protein
MAGICWHVGQAALSRHLMAPALHFLSLQGRHSADGDTDVAILCVAWLISTSR